jgi:hypothetical protein
VLLRAPRRQLQDFSGLDDLFHLHRERSRVLLADSFGDVDSSSTGLLGHRRSSKEEIKVSGFAV